MIAVTEWSSDNLPPWFGRVTPRENAQRVLFPDQLSVVLAALRVGEDVLSRWHARGWVPFSPDRRSAQEVNEIRFVRDVARSGLSVACIGELLEQLPRPLNCGPDEVADSFCLGWVWAGPEPEPDANEVADQHIDIWLEDLAAKEDQNRLVELRDRIDQMVSTLQAGPREPND
jgi:hypothetical protein